MWCHGARAAAAVVAAVVGVTLVPPVAAPAYAASSSIDHVQDRGRELQLVVSLSDVPDGAAPALDQVSVSFDGEPLEALAEPVADSTEVRRTTVVAIDVSDSMRGAKFAQAKAAARTFLDRVPEDVSVGLVTYAGEVRVVQPPTHELARVTAAVDALTLSPGTRLYDGLTRAVTSSGQQGSRSVLVLSDGRDTSSASLQAARRSVQRSGVKVDVVALGQSAADRLLLEQLASAGNGSVLDADPASLTRLFADEARTLARQVLVTVTAPPELAGREGTMAVRLPVAGDEVVDEAFVSLPRRTAESPPPSSEQTQPAVAVSEVGLLAGQQISRPMMLGGLVAAALAVAVLVVLAFGARPSERQDVIDRSIEAYTRKGAAQLAQAQRASLGSGSHGSHGSSAVTARAVGVAQNVLRGREGLEVALGDRLDAAGIALKPAEWLLVRAASTVLLGLCGLLLGSGNVLFMLGGLLVGGVAPMVFLTLKRSRRVKAFHAQLADTLQLMAGSLSAGLSLAQSADAVVREGTDPMAGEFRRALVETRLGVDIEDALSGVADRMHSVDFEWVVMAIRIQREVGGNLAELLNKVAETIREREYLQRQVKTLSAEGRLSVWILGGLPPAFLAYLALANPAYLAPMFTSPLGWAMLMVMTVLLVGGVFWMKQVVKVEV